MIKFAVDEARIPSLSSFAPREKPGVSVGTIKADIPLCLLCMKERLVHKREYIVLHVL